MYGIVKSDFLFDDYMSISILGSGCSQVTYYLIDFLYLIDYIYVFI